MFVSLQEELAFFKTLFAIACIVALIGGTLFCLVLRRYALRTRKYERDVDDLLSALARAKAGLDWEPRPVERQRQLKCEVCGTPITKLFAGGAQVCGAGCAIAQGV